jgi:hypothetical protein
MYVCARFSSLHCLVGVCRFVCYYPTCDLFAASNGKSSVLLFSSVHCLVWVCRFVWNLFQLATCLQQATVAVVTYVDDRSLPVECRAAFCKFIYDSALTPALSTVTPSTISAAPTAISIVGTGFGTVQADVSVTIGGATCVISSVTDTTIECTAGDVPAGTHIPKVWCLMFYALFIV